MQKFEELSKTDKEYLVSSGLQFLGALTCTLGPESGIAVWEKLADSFDSDYKGALFFAMVSGSGGSRHIRLSVPPIATRSAVPIIKVIRTYSGYGLKEAKDIYEDAQISPTMFEVHDARASKDCVNELQRLGCIVS